MALSLLIYLLFAFLRAEFYALKRQLANSTFNIERDGLKSVEGPDTVKY